MVQQQKIVWTKRAQQERLEILEFWIEQNDSTAYSKKLKGLIQEALELIKMHPNIGRATDISKKIRVEFLRDYEIFYQIEKSTI